MNYDTLKASIISWTENQSSEFISEIPVFVRVTEEVIRHHIKYYDLNKSVSGTLATGASQVTLPEDFETMLAFIIRPLDISEPLLQKQVDYIYAAKLNSRTGDPRFYAMLDSRVALVAPKPGAETPYYIRYRSKPASIVDAGTSWLGDHAEGALLYGSLLQAYIFMKGEADILAAYKEFFLEALALLKGEAEGFGSSDSNRNNDPRVPINGDRP